MALKFEKFGATFIPAFSPGREMRREKWMTWWIKGESKLYYDKLLYSAYYGIDTKDFSDLMKIDRKKVMFMSDSGGFQVLSGNKKLNALHVLRWMERNSDIGIILDYPPYLDKMKHKTNRKLFEKSISITVRNSEKMYNYREKKNNFLLYTTLHGLSMSDIDEWWNRVCEPYEGSFDGIAVGAGLLDTYVSCLLHNKGFKKNIHILGRGCGIEELIAYTYLGKYIKNFSYDMSAHNMGSRWRNYLLPDIGMHFHIRYGDNLGDVPTFQTLPCICPVCKTLDLKKASSLELADLINVHNLWVYLLRVKTLNTLIEDEDTYRRFVKRIAEKSNRKDIVKKLDFIRDAMEVDFDYAKRKYYPNNIGQWI